MARPDIGFLLYAAGRVLDGAKLYVDIVEINPPLIIALNIPPAFIARLLGISDILVYRLCFAVGLCGSLILAWRALARALPAERLDLRRLLFLLLAFALFPLAAQDFGQREHLLLALVGPYLLTVAGRIGGRGPTRAEAIVIGTLAGIALALKPHFLPLWVALEIYARRTTKGAAVRTASESPESLTIGLVLVGYAAVVVLATPEYFQLILRLGGLYHRFLNESFFQLLVTGPGASLVWLSLLTCVALRSHARHPHLWTVVAIAVVACFLGAALQQKGLRYHFYPSFALAVVLLGLAAVDLRLPLRSLVQRVYRTLALSLAITTVMVVTVENFGQLAGRGNSPEQADLDTLVGQVRVHAPGQSIFVMSYHIGSAFPLVNYSGARLASRFPHLWMLAASYMDELKADGPLRYRSPGMMTPGERYLNEAVLADLQSHRPRMLIVLRNARDLSENGYRRLDYLAYFGRDPHISRILAQYQRVGLVGEYALYRRMNSGEARMGPPPAAERATQDVVRKDRQGLQLRIKDQAFLLRLFAFVFVLTGVLCAGRDRRPSAIGA